MVSLAEAKSANMALSQSKPSLTAVFVGATHGIGLATLQAFARHVEYPTAIIVGRSAARFDPELQNLTTINPNGQFTFLEVNVSLIKNIDAACRQIRTHTSHIDLLFTSQGYLGFAGRENNADGLDNSVSLRYYGRVRFAEQLLPLLAPHARVISVLAGGKEGKIFEDDLDLVQKYSIGNANAQFTSMMTLSFDHLAAQNLDKAFLHIFPGLVSTGLLARSATGVLSTVFRWVIEPLLSMFAAKPQDVGERMLAYATSEQFEHGSWSLDQDGTSKEVAVLREYRQRGLSAVINEHNQKMFEVALAKSKA